MVMDNDKKSKKPHKAHRPRKISLPTQKIQNRMSVDELRENYKRQLSLPKDKDVLPMHDPLQKAQDSVLKLRGKTGVIYNIDVNKHFCLWDSTYPENPERLNCILRRCNELELFSECQVLEPTVATQHYIQTLHTEELFETLKSSQNISDHEELEELSSRYDCVYLNQDTFQSSLIAAGCTLEIVEAVLEDKIQNGMSLIRPPGHHAMKNDLCGYCFFNNVALAANYALEERHLERILIVDWDIHHGQATQQFFYDDPRVLYFSTHRYEHGTFWPNLRESDYDYIGKGTGKGYNFNIPLNQVGLNNGDFLAYFHQVLLPVAYEFSPDLVIISAGYDSAYGDAKGKMKLTPAFYSHMTTMLMGLANGKVVAVLEGGYCPASLSEGAAHTLMALLGKPCPSLIDSIEPASQSMRESLLNVIFTHKPYWKCLQYQDNENTDDLPLHIPSITFNQPPPIIGRKYETMLCHESYLKAELEIILTDLERIKKGTSLAESLHKVCLVYDEKMENHVNLYEKNFPEKPSRTQEIMKVLDEFGILERINRIKSRKATASEIELVHGSKLTEMIYSLPNLSSRELRNLQSDFDSIYFHEKTAEASLLASGCLLQVVDSVCNKESQSGIAVIRPPGHHAEENKPYGFCIFNNVAVAAMYALKTYHLKRILIIDWDVHHGNGIQHTFETNPEVLYISIHLYKNGNFFPYSTDADLCCVGKGPGKGFNINIPWNKSGMGDAEYIAAFTQIVLPVAYQFDPQLVLVAAGFDAAINDPLGGCHVTPECFGHMTHLLKTLANGNIILALEGGYNVSSISHSMAMCAKSLLGDPLPSLKSNLAPNKSAVKTIKDVICVQKKYWKSLCFQVSFPSPFSLQAKVSILDRGVGDINLESTVGTHVKDTSVDSDSEFLTPPQSPEHQLLLVSSQLKPSVDDLSEDLSLLNLSDKAFKPATTVPLPSESSDKSLNPPSLSLPKRSETLELDTATLNPSQVSANISLPKQDLPSFSQTAQVSSGLPQEVVNCAKYALTIPSSSNLPPVLSCVQPGKQNEIAGPSKEIAGDPPTEDNEQEGAVGGTFQAPQGDLSIGQLLMGQQEMYAVVPLSNCPHLVEVMPVPSRGVNAFSPCEECLDPSENWLCLTCYSVLCGRYIGEHMMVHSLCVDHHIVLSYSDLSVWCYACESYVDNEVLKESKLAAHRSKFDVDLPF